jgi:hypothetical protein
MANSLIIPPYRASLLTNTDGSPMSANGAGDTVATEKQWYMFWSDLAAQLNANTGKIAGVAGARYGNHADRPSPKFAPDGVLYLEQDRGSALYQNQGGIWQYIAGTMYGTLSPDQRPVDLGPAADVGFEFKTNVAPARSFVWNGGQWVETTPLQYGTHAARLAVVIANLVSGTLWMETDRTNVIYQVQTVAGSPAWVYVGGMMTGAFSGLPAGLGTNDANFTYATSDTYEVYRWSGSAWVNQTPANTVQLVGPTGTTTITTLMQDIAGLSITLTRPGRYLGIGVMDFSIAGGDVGNIFTAQLVLPSGGAAPQLIVFLPSVGGLRATVCQQWTFTGIAGQITKIQASKSGGTGASVSSGHCSLSAVWLGP